MKRSGIISIIYTGIIITNLFSIACTNRPTAEKSSEHKKVKSVAAEPWEKLTRDAVLALKKCKPEEAKRLCSNALDLVNEPGKEDLRTVKTYILFGQIYRWEKNYTDAEKSFKQAIEVCEKTVGPNHPDMITPLESLANLYYYTLIDLEKVAKLYLRILNIVETNTSPNDFQMAIWSSNLALVYQELLQYEKAEPYFKKALTISESGEQYVEEDIAQYLYLCASFYEAWGKCLKAEQYALRLVKIRENNREEHIDARFNLANSMDMLGSIYLLCNKPEEAEKLYKHSIRIIKKAIKKEDIRNGSNKKVYDHPNMAIHLTGLAESLGQQGKYADANIYYQEALVIAKKYMGTEAVEVADILEKYAESLHKTGNEVEAKKVIQNAEEIRKNM
jgi:tetratricopeptide (TPR) repeat protein